VITFNAAISSCERGDQWEMALLLLEEMEEKRIWSVNSKSF